MRIATVRHALPSRRITNTEVIERFRETNVGEWGTRIGVLTDRVAAALEAAGTVTRFALAEGETAMECALRAGRDALTASRSAPETIDLLLYAGVARGWLEPATAPAVQAGLGVANATCFDVTDACASWLRALEVAHALMRTGRYRRTMIVNAECGMYRAYADWRVSSVEELDYRLGGYTIGEAATATVVTNETPDDDFEFLSRTFGEHLDLCMIPFRNVGDFLPTPPTERHEAGRFFALSKDLFGIATREVVRLFEGDPAFRQRTYDIAFGHDAATKASRAVSQALGVEEMFFRTHADYGNTVSATVPLAMSLALDQGRLKRGQRVLVMVASAGISIGFASFTF